MTEPDGAAADLALHLRTELSDKAPQGFHFTDHLIRQDAALGQLVERLRAEPPAELEQALGLAVLQEDDGWTLLKLLEVAERLSLRGVAPALMKLVEERQARGDERSRFLAGRACEVLLRLPLDLESRARASALSQAPLAEVARFRMSAEKVRALHRPRRVEWALLVALMALGLAGLLFAIQATGR